ncbi:MAG: HAD-IIA family hydrolase [Halolamina sp.]
MLRAVALDVDGTVVRGDELLPGAAEGMAAVADAGLDRLFVTNNPTRKPAAYVEKLERAGLTASAEEIVTAATSTVAYLEAEYPGATVAVVGEDAVTERLRDGGVDAADVTAASEPAVGVVGIDRAFDYERLTAALRTLDGIPWIGTDPDAVIPAAEGDVPGSGAMVRAVAGVLERDPEAVLGKPSATTRRLVLDRLGVAPEECLVVGDRLDTDIAMGAAAGMKTALVETGVAGGRSGAEREPDYVLDSLAGLKSVLAAEGV